MIKVTHRYFNRESGLFCYENAGTFKTYKEAVETFNGIQDWFNKKHHRFTANGDLYLMSKDN